jgi:GT2 family glycosyltransferase/SAM-dependent methyltransferase
VPRRESVGVVITTYNHARFLDEALCSVAAQRVKADSVIVVDDGSNDDPGSVVARFPGVDLIRQPNRGLSAARNAGLSALDTTYVIFLDADDRLEPGAIDAGLACFARAPQSGLVYGGHLYMNRDGEVIGRRFEPPGESVYRSLLGGNFIAMHGAVMYRRECLVALGGFDERLPRCEDYDLYLRMSRAYPITGYPEFVASYRLHGTNMSADHWTMLQSALAVQARHAPAAVDRLDHEAWIAGRRRWRRCYAEEMAFARYRARLDGATLASTLPALIRIARAAPTVAASESIGGLRRRIGKLLPARYRPRLMRRRESVPRIGHVRFGDLHRTTPISTEFGFDRGQPIDRLYIERFLERNAAAIGGRVLEIGDDTYTRRFGGDRVSRVDILHVHGGNPRATIVGDLADPRVLPADAYDCIVLTQTLHLIYDVHAAIRCLHRALAPGGVVLVTVPGISQIDRGEWRGSWLWSFTSESVRRLFTEAFGADGVTVEHYGNVFAATAFLHGLAVAEVPAADLEPIDDVYQLVVAVRARKRSR